jgi:predicted RNA-binding protein
MKPFHNAREWRDILSNVHENLGERSSRIHMCVYSAPFGIVPLELDEVYPLSQHEVAVPLDTETVDYVAGQVAAYVEGMSYEKIVFLEDQKIWRRVVTNACRRACKKKNIRFSNLRRQGTKDAFVTGLLEALRM